MFQLGLAAALIRSALSQAPWEVRETALFEYASFDEIINWNEAEMRCRDWYGHLVSIHNEQENDLVREMMRSIPKRDDIRRFVWLGGRHPDNGREEDIEWTDGSPFNYLYGNEVCYASSTHECLIFYDRDTDCWGDWECRDLSLDALNREMRGFICKRPKECCTAYDKFRKYNPICEAHMMEDRCVAQSGPCNWGSCPRGGCCQYFRGKDIWKRKCPRYKNEFSCEYPGRGRDKRCRWRRDCMNEGESALF